MSAQNTTLRVENLQTHFITKAGTVKAVDDVSFTVHHGRVLGLVGESGAGKSVTGFSIIGLVDPPGRIVGGRIMFHDTNLVGLPEDRMRAFRGSKIAMIFQDPLTTLNPVLRIDTQMIEAILALVKRPVMRSVGWEFHRPKSACALILTNFPAGCASVW